MIRTRTPLRLGLAGGGTDLAEFYSVHGGATLNVTISRFAHVLINQTPAKLVFSAGDLQASEEFPEGTPVPVDGPTRLVAGTHNYFLENFGLPAGGLLVSTSVEAPVGSGLGASSTLTVGLVSAFAKLVGVEMDPYILAETAYSVEREYCRIPGGKQDHYSAAFGGLNFVEYYEDGSTLVQPLNLSRSHLVELEESLVAVFSGESRKSLKIVEEQQLLARQKSSDQKSPFRKILSSAYNARDAILRHDFEELRKALDTGWSAKKETSSEVAVPSVMRVLQSGIEAGAYSSKVSGAGGGGFVVFLVDPGTKSGFISDLQAMGLPAERVNFTEAGVEVW